MELHFVRFERFDTLYNINSGFNLQHTRVNDIRHHRHDKRQCIVSLECVHKSANENLVGQEI